MRTLLATTTILTLGATAALVAGPSGYAAQTRAVTGPTPTHFALHGEGYGSVVTGGEVPTSSDRSAYQIIGCTNKAGLDRGNHVLEESLPGVGTASEVRTQVWTTDRRGVVSSYARNSIARIVMDDSPLGTLTIDGILSQSRAFHDATGFHTKSTTDIAAISFTPAGGEPVNQPIPTPGDPVVVPGVARLSVGDTASTITEDGSHVRTDALQIDALVSGTRTRIAHSATDIARGVRSGLFSGSSSGTQGETLDGTVTSGRSPLLVMPCQGTGGDLRSNATTSSRLDGGLFAQGLSTKDSSDQDRTGAFGFEAGRIQTINLGDGQLIATGIVGRVNVTRLANGTLRRSINGTRIGAITANGEPQTFPDTDVLKIPGVARLERNVVTQVPGGLHVVSLRLTLLDGSGAVYNLGEAGLRIKASGN